MRDRSAPSHDGADSSDGRGARGRERIREDLRLLERYHSHGDEVAREELIRRFLPLARQLARRYERGDEQLDDLVQVASVGLVKAVERFDPSRGTAFSSFAVPTIAGELKRHFRDKGWAIKVPRDLQELARRVDRTTDRLVHDLGRTPTAAEIADDLEITLEQVLDAREAATAYRADSLDRPSGDDHDAASVVDTLGAPEPGYLQAERSATLQSMMSVLDDREREILRLRFAEDLTQAEIGERVGVSQMHVSRLLRRAVTRLREAAQPSEAPAAPEQG
jgi:RNA polymerase sigma-B factor